VPPGLHLLAVDVALLRAHPHQVILPLHSIFFLFIFVHACSVHPPSSSWSLVLLIPPAAAAAIAAAAAGCKDCLPCVFLHGPAAKHAVLNAGLC